MKKKVIILCTGNSCRSQMAEGFLRHYGGASAEIYSAGLEAHGLNPRAVEAMREAGIDISKHTSNRVEAYKDIAFDYVITVCDHAQEHCPVFPGRGLRLHFNFPDPAKAKGSDHQIMAEFRRVRDQIRDYCQKFSREHLS